MIRKSEGPRQRGGLHPAKGQLVLFLAAAQLLFCIEHSAAIEKDRTLVEVGIALGTKTSMLFGVRYFVAENLALGIDLLAAPVGRFSLGIGLDLAYYPAFLSGYGYAAAGVSYLFARFEQWQGAIAVPVTMNTLALSACLGGNSPTFMMPPAVESDNEADVPTVVYAEIGVGRFLVRSLKRNGLEVGMGDPGASPWVFPDIELGLRQGPFTPAWAQ